MAVIVSGGTPNQFTFRSLFDQIWAVEITGFSTTSIANGASAAVQSFTVPGVQLTDDVITWVHSADPAGLLINAWVSGANTVKVIVTNNTGGALSLSAGTLRLVIGRPSANLFP